MEGKHVQKKNASSDKRRQKPRQSAAQPEPEIRAYPQARQVYVSPEQEDQPARISRETWQSFDSSPRRRYSEASGSEEPSSGDWRKEPAEYEERSTRSRRAEPAEYEERSTRSRRAEPAEYEARSARSRRVEPMEYEERSARSRRVEPTEYEEERSARSRRAETTYDEEVRTRGRRYESDPEKRSYRWLIWVIPLVLVLAGAVVLLGLVASTANRISSIETIFPNVHISGVNVGGLTPAEAVQALTDAGVDPYHDAAVTVQLPQGEALTITAEDVGLTADPAAAVEEAYAYGRSGGLLQDIQAYRASAKRDVNIAWSANPQLDESALRAKVAAAVGELALEAVNGETTIGEDGVTLVKSRSGVSIDLEDVISRVRQAFLNRDYADIQIEPTVSGSEMTTEEAESMLLAINERVHVEPQNAEYDRTTGGVTESVRGVSIDIEDALSIWNAAKPGETIFIPFTFTEPEIDSATLASRMFADLLAEKTTSLSGSTSARINNVELAAQAMDGTVVNPGDTFDYNTCLGERTAARGYQAAGAYAGGQHVTEIGGGICQGSSTLYYCALYANMGIDVRDCHYFTVSYLPMGFDATVSWGGPDFRFVNGRDYPIKIRAWVSDGNLTVQIWGTSDGTWVEMSSETWEDAEFYYARTYRTVYRADGYVLSSGYEAYSRYHKYEAGAEPTEEPTATPEVTATPEPTPEPTPEEITPEPVTPEPVTPEPEPTPEPPEPITPEPETPEPEPTPEPETPEPVTPEPETPEPATPEPETPEPATPEPETPEPVTPEPVTPEPVTPEPVTPEPVTPEPEPEVPEPVQPLPEIEPDTVPEPLPEEGV